MKDGRIQCEGPPREVMTDHNLQAIFGSDKVIYTHQHGHE